MKNTCLMFVLIPFVFSCAGGSKTTEKQPDWITKFGLYENVIMAVGIGDGLNERIAKDKAALDGRKKIAESLQTQIKSLTTNFVEEAGTIGETSSESVAQEYFQEITQSLTNVTVNGSVVEEYWPPLGMTEGNKVKFYAKVTLKKNVLVDEFRKKIQEDAANKKIKSVKASADDALKALDNAIMKWEKSGK